MKTIHLTCNLLLATGTSLRGRPQRLQKTLSLRGAKRHVFECGKAARSNLRDCFAPTGLAMTILLGALITCFFARVSVVEAAVPKLMTYQGILKNSSGNFLTGTYSMTFKLYNASMGGSPLWTETQSLVSVSSGRFSVQLGNVTALNLDFSKDYWIGVKVGTDLEMTPRVRITSVGYAYMADNVVNGFTQAQHDALSHKNIEGVKANTSNIAKTNFKLDAYTKASANGMGDMIVDTFNDATGIDATQSTGYLWRGSPDYDVTRQAAYTDQTGSGLASASSYYPGQLPSKAFDNVIHSSNEWSPSALPSPSAPEWLAYDFGAGNGKTITRYTLSNAEAYGYNRTRAPKDWTFEGSNDNTNWTVLDTRSGIPWDCDTCTKAFDCTNSTAYRYYRIKITANNGGPTFVEIAEMELMLAPAGSAPIYSIAFAETVASKEAMVIADETLKTGTLTYYVSRDNGTTWTLCPKDTVVNISSQPSGTQIKWKAIITNDAELNAIAVAL